MLVVDGDGVVVWALPEVPVAAALRDLGLGRDGDPGSWRGRWELLEPVCSTLDQLGYRWAVENFDGPRTWAERLFAEVPRHLAEALYLAVRGVLESPDGDRDHASVLEWAWRHRPVDQHGTDGLVSGER